MAIGEQAWAFFNIEYGDLSRAACVQSPIFLLAVNCFGRIDGVHGNDLVQRNIEGPEL